jgi:lipid-A-disaccharide synthase
LIALLPGSRRSEIRVLASRMAEAAALVNGQIPVRVVAAVPRELAEEAHSHLPPHIRIVSDCANELLLAADAAIVKTGTATLEAVLANTPQVAVYDVPLIGRVEWCLLWAWRRIPFIAMPNIILQRQAVPELIGLDCQPKKIADTLLRILQNEGEREKIRRAYVSIRQALGSELLTMPTERTAQIVEEMLDEMATRVEPEPVAV